MEILVDQMCRMAPGSAVSRVLEMVLGRASDDGMAGGMSRVLLKALL